MKLKQTIKRILREDFDTDRLKLLRRLNFEILDRIFNESLDYVSEKNKKNLWGNFTNITLDKFKQLVVARTLEDGYANIVNEKPKDDLMFMELWNFILDFYSEKMTERWEEINKIKKTRLKEESELPLKVRRRINYDEENVINLLKKFALRHLGRNVKIHILTRLACKDTAYELLDGIQLQFGDKEYMYIEDVLTDYLEEKYSEQIEEFISDFYSKSGDELGSKYVFEKHSERYGGSGFSEGYETWNMLLRIYASWFPDLNWKELKEKLDGMGSGGKILIKKPGDLNNPYGYYFSLHRFDAK